MKRQEVQRARKVREDREAAERVEADRKAEDASMWKEVEDYKRCTITLDMVEVGQSTHHSVPI